MNDNRLGGLALILGAVSGILTLTFHPAGGEHRVTPAQFETLIAVVIGVHALAITGLPVSFAGALALTHRIDSHLRLALFGLIIYGLGLIAVMIAATMSGLVTPDILRQSVSHTAAADQSHSLMAYTHTINQGFARIGTIAFSAAIFLWSIVIVKERAMPVGLGIYGLVSAIAIVIGVVSGRLDLELHGFRIVTLIQAIWFFTAGLFLWKTNDPAADHSTIAVETEPIVKANTFA